MVDGQYNPAILYQSQRAGVFKARLLATGTVMLIVGFLLGRYLLGDDLHVVSRHFPATSLRSSGGAPPSEISVPSSPAVSGLEAAGTAGSKSHAGNFDDDTHRPTVSINTADPFAAQDDVPVVATAKPPAVEFCGLDPTIAAGTLPSTREALRKAGGLKHPTYPERAIAPHGYIGRFCRVCAGLKRALREGILNIMVYGGSMTAGHGVPDSKRKMNRWTGRLKSSLHSMGWPTSVQVTNHAHPAMLSQNMVPSLHLHSKEFAKAHLLILDFAINDRPMDQIALRKISNKTRLRQASAVALIDLLQNQFLSKQTGLLMFETISRMLLATSLGSPEMVVASRESHDPRFASWIPATEAFSRFGCDFDVARLFHWPAVVERQVPIVSYVDGVCSSPGSEFNKKFWDAHTDAHGAFPSHPDEIAHRYCGRVVAGAIWEIATARCSDPVGIKNSSWPSAVVSMNEDMAAQDVEGCNVPFPSTFYRASDGRDAFPARSVGAAWRFFEDRPGKPGWIALPSPMCATKAASSTPAAFKSCGIRFSPFFALSVTPNFFQHHDAHLSPPSGFRTGDTSTVTLTVLVSYDTANQKMGSFACQIDNQGMEYAHEFSTSSQGRVSQGVAVTLASNIIPAPMTTRPRMHMLSCVYWGGKVKVLGLTAC